MSKTILTIDDSASMRQMITFTLSTAGYSVIEASDGAEGYEKATSNSFDAIVTDLNMPKMNGIEFIKRFRDHPSGAGVPVIFLTTESNEEAKGQAIAAGATGWIVKPFTEDTLLVAVKKMVGE